MDELNQIRNLLLKNEQEELRTLKETIEELKESSSSPELIIERISPNLASIIKKSSSKDEKLLNEALSPIVFDLIDQNFIHSKDKITKQIAPLITVAIREQIKSQKDEVVDALYPVLGNMISKYVSKTFEEMMDAINTQITNGLSFSVLSRKFRAKIKGVSETELLLSENAIASIRSVFLIHKETGIVLSHAEHEDNPIKEPEMIASMMTAIRSFVNDWVDKNEAHHEIGTIEYGGSKIILEASGHSYLAVIVDGLASSKTNERIRKVLEKIVSEHWNEIKNFNGDMNSISSEKLEEKLTTLIHKNETSKKSKKTHPIMYLIPIVLLSWIGWITYNSYVDETIEKTANSSLYKNPKLTMYRLNASVEDKILILDGVVPSKELKELATKEIEDIKNLEKIENQIIVIEQKEKLIIKEKKSTLLRDKIEFLVTALNVDEDINLSYNLDDNKNLVLNAEVINKKKKEYILKQFKNIKELTSIQDKITIIPPFLDTLIYFDFGSPKIKEKEEYKLIKLINLLSKTDSDFILKVIVSNDSLGSSKINQQLNMKRLLNVKKYLEEKGHILQNIELEEKDKSLDKEYINKKTKHDRYIMFSLENRNK